MRGVLIALVAFSFSVGLWGVLHAPHHDQCVICKPSGKLAMWGECD